MSAPQPVSKALSTMIHELDTAMSVCTNAATLAKLSANSRKNKMPDSGSTSPLALPFPPAIARRKSSVGCMKQGGRISGKSSNAELSPRKEMPSSPSLHISPATMQDVEDTVSLCSDDTALSSSTVTVLLSPRVKSKESLTAVMLQQLPKPPAISRRSSSVGCIQSGSSSPSPTDTPSHEDLTIPVDPTELEGVSASKLDLSPFTENFMKEQRIRQRKFESLLREKAAEKAMEKEREAAAATWKSTFALRDI